MKHKITIRLFILGVAVICLTGMWFYLVNKAERDARNLFGQALRLKVGNSSAAEVLNFARNAPGKKYGFEACSAGLTGCTGTIFVANTWLSRFRFAPPISFGVRFGISNNLLTNREFMMDLDGMYGKESYGEAAVNERVPDPGKPPFIVRGWSSGILVNMTTDAAGNLKSLAYNFNFHCLAKIGGCKRYEEMLPILERKDLTGSDPWHITLNK